MAIRQSSGNQTPIIENNAGTFQGTILHTGFDGSINGDFKFSSIALELSGHSFNAYFDTSTRRNYIHLYPSESSDRGTSASQTDIRAWTGTTFKTLVIKGDADPTWDGNNIIHTGNASSQLGQFVRADQSDQMNGVLTVSSGTHQKLILAGSNNPKITLQEGTTDKASICLLYTSPSPRDLSTSRMPSSA